MDYVFGGGVGEIEENWVGCCLIGLLFGEVGDCVVELVVCGGGD